jgi:hypothetical protein
MPPRAVVRWSVILHLLQLSLLPLALSFAGAQMRRRTRLRFDAETQSAYTDAALYQEPLMSGMIMSQFFSINSK